MSAIPWSPSPVARDRVRGWLSSPGRSSPVSRDSQGMARDGDPLAQGMGPLRVAPCPRGWPGDARPLPRGWPGDAAGTDEAKGWAPCCAYVLLRIVRADPQGQEKGFENDSALCWHHTRTCDQESDQALQDACKTPCQLEVRSRCQSKA
jgi:hypothetical protein